MAITNEEESAGDIFHQGSWPGVYVQCSTWHVEDKHKISLRHCTVSGNWVLLLDGKCVGKGCEPVALLNSNNFFEIEVPLCGNNESACIKCSREYMMSYSHTLLINENTQEKFENQLNDSFHETNKHKVASIRISSCELRKKAGETIVFYIIETKTTTGKTSRISRSFDEFQILNSVMRLHFYGSHMLESLPKLPTKFHLFVNQLSPSFIAKRQAALESYLNMLLGFEKATKYMEFLCFVGLNPLSGLPEHLNGSTMNES